MYQESEERAELYRCWPPAKLQVPILVQPAAVNNDIPEESDIDMAVQGLKLGRVGWASVMIVEDLKGWRKEAK